MEITLNKKEFIDALAIGGSFAGKSKVMPILQCVKIKVSNQHIKIVSSDGENTISKTSDVISSDEENVFCVNYKDIYSYVKLIGSDTFKLSISDDFVDIIHDKGNMEIPKINPDEFPISKMDDDCKCFEIESYLINNWIVDGRYFVDDDDIRPILNNIYFYSEKGETGCCATDGRGLFTDHTNKSIEDFSFTLNKGAFSPLMNICKECDTVSIRLSRNNVMFKGNDVSLLCCLNTDRFPNFKSVIPLYSPIHVKLQKSEFIDAINRAKLGSNNATCMIKIEVDGMSMRVSAQDLDFNIKAVENIFVEADGNITIGFNANKLINCINSISTENVILNMTDASRACVINENKENSHKTVLLMPIMLNY